MRKQVRSNAVFALRVWRAKSRGIQVLIALAVIAFGTAVLLAITTLP